MSLRERWNALPRTGRWLILAALFIGAYFVVIEPALDATASLAARGDVLQAGLERRRANDQRGGEAETRSALAAARFGETFPPGGAERAGELNACVERVLREKQVSSLTIRSRALTPLGRSAFAGVISESEQAQRLVLDVDFECAPAVAMEIISELEQSPEVTALGRVILRKAGGEEKKVLQVSLAPETWVITPKRGER